MMGQTHQQKIIHVAADHAGFDHKEAIKLWLVEQGFSVIDHGAKQKDDEDDFPDYIGGAAAAVAKSPEQSIGIIFGGSGQGEAMVANRFKGVRATVYYGGDTKIITLSREHNDANVLSIGARFVDISLAKKVITAWLNASFSGEEKRIRRNRKLEHLT